MAQNLYVFVWDFAWRVGRGGMGVIPAPHYGHAAILLSDRKTYISWWPYNPVQGNFAAQTLGHDFREEMSVATRVKLDRGQLQSRPGQVYGRTTHLTSMNGESFTVRFREDSEEEIWAAKPDRVIDIPSFCTNENALISNRGIGLDEDNMRAWWRVYSMRFKAQGVSRHAKYEDISKNTNCVGAVIGALYAGGAGAYTNASMPIPNTVPVKKWLPFRQFYHPNDLAAFATSLRGQIRSYSDMTKTIRRQANQNHMLLLNARMDVHRDGDIMSLAAWKKLGVFGRRKDQVARIDQLMRQYHQLGDWGDDNFQNKANLLMLMLEQARDHMNQKPRSARRMHILLLATQIIELLCNPPLKLRIVRDRLTQRVSNAMELFVPL